MKKPIKRIILPLAICIANFSNQALSAEYIFDTSSGFIFKDGAVVDNINGVKVTQSLISGGSVVQFAIKGDLNLGPTDSIVGRGARGASILVGNNANIHADASINFSKGGGGTGGQGGAGGAGGIGGQGGAGGREFYFELFSPNNVLSGAGGAGNQPDCTVVCAPDHGSWGVTGEEGADGVIGGIGFAGQDGDRGGAGLNNHFFAAGVGGENHDFLYTQGGSGGNGGRGGLGGVGGAKQIIGREATNGDEGFMGGDGYQGSKGNDGTSGTNGLGGQNWGGGTTISGGAGGGGGSGGFGGSGAGGSGGGGAGGGGGGTLTAYYIGEPIRGGDGGNGGAGAQGVNGGAGGDGERGGRGGHGGGAVELIVRGQLNASGSFIAQGGDGQEGYGNTSGFDGESTREGELGQVGEGRRMLSSDAVITLTSGAGGIGGKGGTSHEANSGGDGGDGGTGGGGAGGTVKLIASVLNAKNADVNTAGGNSGQLNRGGDGRFIHGSNTSNTGPNLIGSRATEATGSTTESPYYEFPGNLIPYIPDLVGGAEAFGLLEGYNSLDTFFDPFLTSKPSDALGGLLRLDRGPAGYDHDFDGFDMLLFFSLSEHDLSNPMLGIDPLGLSPNFMVELMQGGFANDPLFGGLGDTILNTLGSFKVFGTLIAETDKFFNAKLGSSTLSGTQLENGEIAFLRGTADFDPIVIEIDNPADFGDPTGGPDVQVVAEPSVFAFLIIGFFTLVGHRRITG